MKGSECITHGIKIDVKPGLIPKDETEDKSKNYFSYEVTITNLSDKWVKLMTRHWVIIDGDGNREEVIGDGVVGYFPELFPNESFVYESYCPLLTNWGSMEGTYYFIDKEQNGIEVNVSRFYFSVQE